MSRKAHRQFAAVLLLAISFASVVPSLAQAAWWNPLSWYGDSALAPKKKQTLEEFNAKNRVRGEINGVAIVAEAGGIQTFKVDLVLSPLVPGATSDGLSYYIEADGKNQRAFESFREELKRTGNFPAKLGTVLLHEAGGSAKYVANMIVLSAQPQETFRLIRDSVYRALMLAAQKPDIKTVAIPTIGSGVSGSLTDAQTAAAIITGIGMATSQGAKFEKIHLPIFREFAMFKAYELMMSPVSQGIATREYEKFLPGGSESPEKGVIHYDWAGSDSSLSGGIRVSNVGAIREFEVKPFKAYSMGGVTHVHAISDPARLQGEVEKLGERVYLLSRRVDSQMYRDGYYTERTLYYHVPADRDYAPKSVIAENIVHEVVTAAHSKIGSIGFSLTTDFVGLDTRAESARATIADGVMSAIHRLRQENVKMSQISITVDPKLSGNVQTLKIFKSVVDDYAVANMKLYDERIGYTSPKVCKAAL